MAKAFRKVSLAVAGQEVIKAIYKKPRSSTKTRIEASLTHKSVKQVRASRAKPEMLTGAEENIVVNSPRLKIQDRKGGWARVTYTDPNAKGPVTFNIRMSQIKSVMNKPITPWFNPAEAVYSRWINTTKAGANYTARRQVEGMLKVALKRGETEFAERIRKVLEKSDAEVAKFRRDWVNSHTDEEIADWYDYEDEEEEW